MSIQIELTRLTNAKSAIKAAIESKGVTVPDGTLLDGMASLIESIEAGVGAEVRYILLALLLFPAKQKQKAMYWNMVLE